MSDGARKMARRFPAPSALVRDLFVQLQVAAESPPKSDMDLRELGRLPRPWDPPTCPREPRRLVYAWLDEVVGWINEEHTWHVERMIPLCWVEHPHIVHELATVACLRWETECAASTKMLEEWHRFTLPTFLDRIAQRIGSSGCPPGRHQPHPGESRCQLYKDSVKQRRAVRVRDTRTDGCD